MKALDKAQDHVRKKGHILAWRSGARPWSALQIYCLECNRKWNVLRSEAPSADSLIAHLNATPRELPTFWDRILEDD